MQIQVEIISVGSPQTVPTKNGKSYQAIEVAYKKDGKIEGKKIMSFTNPAVFKAVGNLSQGQFVTVTTEKNEAGYWQWEAVSVDSDAPTATSTPSAAASGGGTSKSTSSGGNWETKEERSARQVMIVRQSSLSNAVALLSVLGDKKATPDTVIAIAQSFEEYVLGQSTNSNKPVSEFLDIENDIPL